MFILKWLSYILSAAGIAFWLWVVLRFMNGGENHVSFNVLLSSGVFIPAFVISYFLWRKTKSLLQLILVITAVVGFIALIAMYQFDMLLPYEEWIDRGMPDNPFWD